jgi:outer membrane protein assembly factor BamB
MSTSASADQPATKAARRPTHRPWFPIVWPLLLAGICAFAWYWFEDQGYANSMIHGAIILTVMGWAGWIILRSNWGGAQRWGVAGLLLGLLSAFYFQFSPIKVINNGDVGIVGWRWRWSDPDRDLQSQAVQSDVTLDWQTTPQDYSNFLGDGYWAEITGVVLDSDWENNPLQEVWRQRIGAGWSSYALVGDHAVTQEQRGENELVTCYDVKTGDLMWTHVDNVRFDPGGGGSFGSVGPRATPTVYERRVYSHGATGIVNCLDATTGELLWTHDTVTEFHVENLIWGKATSPVIVGDMVVVSVGDAQANTLPTFSQEGNSLVAFDRLSGEVVWKAGARRSSYATPVLATLAGTEQVIVVNEDFVTSHRAEDGLILWEHPWPGRSDGDASTSQPVPVGDDRILLSKGYGTGSELLQVVSDGQQWSTETVWKFPWMKTKMCNVVIRDGYVYGLDDINLLCIELATGKKQWKKRRQPSFGHGQIMLIGDVILAITEEGELLLVEASPEEYRELAAIQALDADQITWNNPAFSSPYLLVRNAEEAVCYRLPLVGPPSTVTADNKIAPGQ